MKHHYEVDLKWESHRKGTLTSPVLDQSVEVATPPEFPKGMEGIWSPEHLFVSSISSCLMTTFLAIAEYSKLEFNSFDVKAIGTLEKVDGKPMISRIVLKPLLIIPDDKLREKAERILHKAEKGCLISNSITSEIVFEPAIEIEEKNPAAYL